MVRKIGYLKTRDSTVLLTNRISERWEFLSQTPPHPDTHTHRTVSGIDPSKGCSSSDGMGSDHLSKIRCKVARKSPLTPKLTKFESDTSNASEKKWRRKIIAPTIKTSAKFCDFAENIFALFQQISLTCKFYYFSFFSF